MAFILNIETATRVCSVSLGKEGKTIASKETQIANSHAEYLSVFIEELLENNNLKPGDLDAVAVSMGPGSYTGLRIGVSTAKGLCYAIDKPLIAVPTLQSMAFGALQMKNEKESLYCPMIDARRMEVYTAFFDGKNKEVRKTQADIIDEHSYKEYFENHTVYFFGDGASKCKDAFQNYTNANFVDNFTMSAQNMIHIAENKYHNNDFEDVAYFEPFYLKEYKAGKPKVKGLE